MEGFGGREGLHSDKKKIAALGKLQEWIRNEKKYETDSGYQNFQVTIHSEIACTFFFF